MDKFTVKQKAEAYDEAIKKAKEALNDGTISSNAIAYLQDIFPELKENKDEKIRKALLKMMHDTPNAACETIYNIHKEECIAWLEKQGGQPRYSIGDVLCDKSCTTLNKDAQPNFEIVDIRNGMYICDKGSFPISQQDEYELVAKKIEQKSDDKIKPFDEFAGLTDFERTLADICIGWTGEELGWKQYIKDNADVLLKIAIEKFNSVQDASFA